VSSSAYILIRFSHKSFAANASDTLNNLKYVTRWDAVDGYYNIIATTKDSSQDIEQLRTLEGQVEITVCKLSDQINNIEFDEEKVYSYALIESDSIANQTLNEQIKTMDGIISCNSSDSRYNLIVLTTADNFNKIDRLIIKDIEPLDGVLRLKQHRIISSNVKQG